MHARDRLLPLAHTLAHLPDQDKQQLEDPHSMYNAGWSHGKERLGDQPDWAKGSFYANPLYDQAGTAAERLRYPFFYPPNIWPAHSLPQLEPAVKILGSIMYQTVKLLARQVDHLTMTAFPSYEPDLLAKEMQHTQKIKGRVLYYFPAPSSPNQVEDNWIAWHNDSGFFTALVPDMYVDDVSGQEIPCPDSHAGLYVVTRDGHPCRVEIPRDCLLIQCGECLQIVTGGLVIATPHMVKAARPDKPNLRVGRASFPVFIDTHPFFPLSAPKGVTREQVLHRTAKSRVPPLDKRWTTDGVCFGEFLGDTFKQYYEWALNK
eukprot:gb/GEZN01011454.1/.p1 GENE.gb/GEZN01011454.1/~~gb/GEZN01011454.1/.p1  ORF type:complete len:318 (-),score=40.42 gb/GEZN01011454.1/:48-1001(-)